jgi:hypothetical protein
MPNEAISTITIVTDFFGIAISLWMALYLLARGRNNRLAFRMVIVLLAIAYYFLNAFTFTLNPTAINQPLRSLSILLALVAAHNLTHYLLPPDLQKKNIWFARGMFALGLITAIVLISAQTTVRDDPRTIDPPLLTPLSIFLGLFQVTAAAGIVYNLSQIFRAGYRPLNRSFYASLALGASVIGYGLIGAIFSLPVPRFIATIMLLCALFLVGYSITRHQVLIERRTLSSDLLISALAVFGLTTIYIFTTNQMGLSLLQITLITILAIASHSAYDLIRETINRINRRQQRALHRQMQNLVRETQSEEGLTNNVRRGLAILCQNLQATSGFIGIRREKGYVISASLHSLPIGTILPFEEITTEDLIQPEGRLNAHSAWLAPAYLAGKQVAAVGIGPRKGLKEYTESDLYWLEDVAEQVGRMVLMHEQAVQGEVSKTNEAATSEKFLSTLAYNPDPAMIKNVEDCLRNLHDYMKLGQSPLVAHLAAPGDTHIEQGKAIHGTLIEMIKSLRPGGDRPTEPLPREWYNYVILNDAYIEDLPDREVMARLYISEGTYYRTRRKALRGVTRALMEASAAG